MRQDVYVCTRGRAVRLLLMAALFCGASAVSAVPLTLYYQVTPTAVAGTYNYDFTLILDNNDSSWVSGQGWGWLIFGDVPSPGPTNLTNFVGNPASLPVGPWTGYSSSGGGHNGPTFSPVLTPWIPTALNDQLTWSGTSTADLPQGQLAWSTLTGHVGSPVPANFTIATRIGAAIDVGATPGTAASVFANAQGPGNDGFVAGEFTFTNTSAAQIASVTQIEVQGGGTGDHNASYTEFSIYREEGTNPGFDIGTDVLIDTGTFSGSPSTATFDLVGVEQDFGPSEVRSYYLVAKLDGSPIPGETFTFQISDLALGATTGMSNVPSATMNGFTIAAPEFEITDASPAQQETAFAGGVPALLQQFTVEYAAGPANTLTSITLTGVQLGGSLQNDFDSINLYRDDNANNGFDPGTDVLVDSLTAFNASDQAVFTLSGTESDFAPGTLREYFVMVEFKATTPNGAQFASQVTAASGGSTGSVVIGVPAPSVGPNPGLLVLASNLHVTLHPAAAPQTQNNDARGPGDNGLVIWDGTLSTLNDPWTVTELEFEGAGTADPQTSYDYLRLFEDMNNNGIFEPGTDLPAGPEGVSFDASNRFSVVLNDDAFPASSSRRFLLVAKLAGVAVTGQTLGALLNDVVATPPAGAQVSGDLGIPNIALVIDLPAVNVTLGPDSPAAYTHKAGATDDVVLAQFRFRAGNDTVVVNGATFSGTGSGSFSSAFSAVEFWLDDGDGVFDAGTDTLLDSVSGGPAMLASFNPPLSIPNAENRDVWVRGSVTATAGIGEALPLTHQVEIASDVDISAPGAIKVLGTPAPVSTVFGVVDFFVTTFTPTSDLVTGGKPITIEGSGFVLPLQVRIGGVVCGGSASLNPAGTMITGLSVPAGGGKNKAIEIDSGTLPTQTLTQTFNYSSVSGGGSGSGSGGCAAGGTSAAWLLLALAPLAAVLRRRKA